MTGPEDGRSSAEANARVARIAAEQRARETARARREIATLQARAEAEKERPPLIRDNPLYARNPKTGGFLDLEPQEPDDDNALLGYRP